MDRGLQKIPNMPRLQQLDAPFWALVVFGTIALGIVACLGVGLAASRNPLHAEILDTDKIVTSLPD